MEFLHVFVEWLFGSVSVLDEGQIGCDFIGKLLGDGLSVLGAEFVVIELQVNLADVDLVLI